MSDTKAKKPSFASFWFGPEMPAYERACIRSFTARGYDFTLYSYDPVTNLPEGVRQGDAHSIADANYLNAFVVGGKASLSHFTDFFRCSLFQKTDEIWVDVDIVLLQERFELDDLSLIAGFETPVSLCGAVLRLDNRDPNLAKTIARIESLAGQKMVWGATGPRLLTEIYGQAMSERALPSKVFYPIKVGEYYKFLLPEFAQECHEACNGSLTLHLWNNKIDKAGVWKDIGPPQGSFLHLAFAKYGADTYFQRFYPENVMRTMLRNELFYGGPDAGFKLSARLAQRNLLRAFRRRLGSTSFGAWER